MRLPRDLSGRDLTRSLESLGYRITRQSGSHIRLTTLDRGEHHVTIPTMKHFGSELCRRFFPPWRPTAV